jgi:hypothetical protein
MGTDIQGTILLQFHHSPKSRLFRYNDPDNILGPHGTVGTTTETQAGTQFMLWALFPAPLILGEDLTQASPQYIATVGNEELLAVNQVCVYFFFINDIS